MLSVSNMIIASFKFKLNFNLCFLHGRLCLQSALVENKVLDATRYGTGTYYSLGYSNVAEPLQREGFAGIRIKYFFKDHASLISKLEFYFYVV